MNISDDGFIEKPELVTWRL